MQQLLRVISIYSISIPFFLYAQSKEFDVKQWPYQAQCKDLLHDKEGREQFALVQTCETMLEFIKAAKKCQQQKNCDPTQKITQALTYLKAAQNYADPEKSQQEIKRACDTIKTYCDNDALPLESEEKARILLLANKIKTFSEFSSIDIDTLKMIELIAQQAGLDQLEEILLSKEDISFINITINALFKGGSAYLTAGTFRKEARALSPFTGQGILPTLANDYNIIGFLIGCAAVWELYWELKKERPNSQFIYSEYELREYAKFLAQKQNK